MIAGVLVSGTNGITINAGATDTVILRGLDINGVGGLGLDGIKIIQAGQVLIEDCQIYGFNPRGISVEPTGANVQVFVSHTRLVDSASNGIVMSPTVPFKAQVILDDVAVSENINFGVSIIGNSAVVVRNSTVADNGVTSSIPNVANIRIDGTSGATPRSRHCRCKRQAPLGILSLNGGVGEGQQLRHPYEWDRVDAIRRRNDFILREQSARQYEQRSIQRPYQFAVGISGVLKARIPAKTAYFCKRRSLQLLSASSAVNFGPSTVYPKVSKTMRCCW